MVKKYVSSRKLCATFELKPTEKQTVTLPKYNTRNKHLLMFVFNNLNSPEEPNFFSQNFYVHKDLAAKCIVYQTFQKEIIIKINSLTCSPD
jgi:hypothetical protein